jgi:hypothetical protein
MIKIKEIKKMKKLKKVKKIKKMEEDYIFFKEKYNEKNIEIQNLFLEKTNLKTENLVLKKQIIRIKNSKDSYKRKVLNKKEKDSNNYNDQNIKNTNKTQNEKRNEKCVTKKHSVYMERMIENDLSLNCTIASIYDSNFQYDDYNDYSSDDFYFDNSLI